MWTSDAGGMWENNLKGILKNMDGEEIPEYPGNFYIETGLMLSTHVDNLTLSGPSKHHAPFPNQLMSEVNVEPPETIYRIRGRHHVHASFDKAQGEENAALGAAPDALIFDMKDKAQQTIDLYKMMANKPAQTPFIPDGTWPKEEEDSPEELTPKACSTPTHHGFQSFGCSPPCL